MHLPIVWRVIVGATNDTRLRLPNWKEIGGSGRIEPRETGLEQRALASGGWLIRCGAAEKPTRAREEGAANRRNCYDARRSLSSRT